MHPDFRATIRRDVVRLVDWHPYLRAAGPMGELARARGRAGTALADVTLVRDDDGEPPSEALATFLAGDSPAARDALEAWAGSVGLPRLWFPDTLVALDPAACGHGGEASTVCTGCRARWTDGRPDFWLGVRRAAKFPVACPLCGSDLPQWRAAAVAAVG